MVGGRERRTLTCKRRRVFSDAKYRKGTEDVAVMFLWASAGIRYEA